MVKKLLTFCSSLTLLVALLASDASACRWCGCGEQGRSGVSYGGYCNSQRWGWYGARKSVPSVEVARRDLMEYYADDDVKIGKIVEKKDYFEAEIFDKNHKLVDRVILHKKSGRIRSIL